MPKSSDFEVNKKALSESRWVETTRTPQNGEALFHIESFGLTSNNISYAAFGDAIGYWKFFPATDPAWGRIPVWGFATVADAGNTALTRGDRFYGYLPMSTSAVMRPERISERGFVDAAAHRAALPATYNLYARCATDPMYRRETEPYYALFRPLWFTSFLLDDLLAENDYFGAKRILLSSASSKTAYGLAYLLKQRGAAPVIGLTSAQNADFVQRLGCYDEVVVYDNLERIRVEPTAYIDFGGSAKVNESIHSHFGDMLKYSGIVGATHWKEVGAPKDLPGPQRIFFFAPTQIQKRSADWGMVELQKRFAAAWESLLASATRASAPWITVERASGATGVQESYVKVLNGSASPQTGYCLSPR